MTEINESDLIRGVYIVTPKSFGDDRGRFTETYRREWFPNGHEMVQGSRSDKTAGSLVGLHFHPTQTDYWYVVAGTARVVLHDLRKGSPTHGATQALELGDNNEIGVYIPPGVGHGFAAVTDMTLTYMVDSYYNPEEELGVAWNDPELALDWGISDPVVSERDQANPKLADLPTDQIPTF